MTSLLAISISVGLLTAFLDVLLTLAHSPDPVFLTDRIGYLVGPILVVLAWTPLVGTLSGWVARSWIRRPWTPGHVAAGTVATTWAIGLVLESMDTPRSVWTRGIVVLGVTLAAWATAELGMNVAQWLLRRRRFFRRTIIGLAAGVVLAAVVATAPAGHRTFRAGDGPCPDAGPARRAGPNILLITVDALRADAARTMTSYRRLSETGTTFTRHTTPAPWTLPAVASILTGLPPQLHGAGRSWSSRSLLAKSALPRSTPTLARLLGAAGYRTHAIVTNPFLTWRYGVDAGFCSFENVTMTGEAVRGLSETTPLRLIRRLWPWLLPSDRADVVRERAIRWLSEEHPTPFFLWVHFLDPHAPYGDRPGASTSLTLELRALQDTDPMAAPFQGVGLLRAGELRPDARERTWIRSLYDQDVRFVDGQIGGLLDDLQAHHQLQHTVVVLTADHGEEFWEHGGVEHGRTLYDEVVHVPLVIAPPGGPVGLRSDLTSAIDLAPTLLAIAGVAGPGLPGVDLLGSGLSVDRPVVLSNLLFGEEWVGVRTSEFKYMRSEDGEERLFDLRRDAGELVNEVGGTADVIPMLRAMVVPELSSAPVARAGASHHIEP